MKTLIILAINFSLILFSNLGFSQYTESEKSGLLYTYQEEKAANEFYSSMYSAYGSKVFENIMNAEKTHMEHVLTLMNSLGIETEGISKEAGYFSNKEIQDLYDQMTKTGSYSLTDALLASARYEEKDIFDLRKLRSEAQNENIINLYDCLNRASENHLRAFVKNLKREGINYKPGILSSEEFNEIVNSQNSPGDCFQIN